MKTFRGTAAAKRLHWVVGCGIAASCLPSAVAAQDQHPVAPPDAGIVDIIVTAQRREEKLQNVPIAVSAVTSDQLTRQGVTNTLDIGRSVPSVTVTNFAGYMLPRVRGIGNSVIGPGYESGVAIYIDGVYMASAPASLLSLNNIARIEVLKGPQGTLFGRNATGGLVQVVTREPSPTPGGTIEMGIDNYRTVTADAYVTGALGPSVSADFAGHVSAQGKGYGVNRFDGTQTNKMDEDIALRSSLLFTPGEGTKIRIAGDYEQNRGTIFSSLRLAPGTSTLFPQPPLPRAWDVDADGPSYSKFKGGGVMARIDQQLGFAQLTSITAYRKSDNLVLVDVDATATPGLDISEHQLDSQLSQEIQLSSAASSSIKWVVGAYYLRSSASYDPSITIFRSPLLAPPTPFGPLSDSTIVGRQRTEALAGYAQATAPIATNTNLTLGIRYSTEKRRLDATQTISIAGGPSHIPAGPIPDQSKRFSQPTWRVSLDHRFSPQLMVYASYNRGFKSGGFNVQAPHDPAYDPEKLDAYEIGFKSDLLDRRLRINASIFDYEYKNLQVSKYNGGITTIYNGAAARIYGLDVDFEARLGAYLTLGGGATLLHDRFTNFPAAIIATPVPGGIIVTSASATGNRLPQTPDFSASVNLDYHVPTAFGQAGLNVSYSYNDGYYTQPDNILRQPHYNTLAVTARIELGSGLGVRLWGRNLTNARIAQSLDSSNFNSVVSYAPPRTYGVTITGKF